jgi:hypothetical protein
LSNPIRLSKRKSAESNLIARNILFNNQVVGELIYHKLPDHDSVIEIDLLEVYETHWKKEIGRYAVNYIKQKYSPKIIIACCLSVRFWMKIGFFYAPEKWGASYYELIINKNIEK